VHGDEKLTAFLELEKVTANHCAAPNSAIPDTFATLLNITGDLAAATLVASFREA
jgi:Na+/H+-dicarboxylate symporter